MLVRERSSRFGLKQQGFKCIHFLVHGVVVVPLVLGVLPAIASAVDLTLVYDQSHSELCSQSRGLKFLSVGMIKKFLSHLTFGVEFVISTRRRY